MPAQGRARLIEGPQEEKKKEARLQYEVLRPPSVDGGFHSPQEQWEDISESHALHQQVAMPTFRSAGTSGFRRLIGVNGQERVMSGELLHTGRMAKWNKQMQGKPRWEVN